MRGYKVSVLLKNSVSLICIILMTSIFGGFEMSNAERDSLESRETPKTISEAKETEDKLKTFSDDLSSTQQIRLAPKSEGIITKETTTEEGQKETTLDRITNTPLEAKEIAGTVEMRAIKEEVKIPTTGPLAFLTGKELDKIIEIIPQLITNSSKTSEIELTEKTNGLIQKDLEIQTRALAKSGLTAEEIKDRNEKYLLAIYSTSASKKLDIATYQKIKSAVFPTLIRLTIISYPTGAEVEVFGNLIGKTIITEKPFEPDKEYTFIFKLPGFKTSVRNFFVTPYPSHQQLEETLKREE